MDGIIYYFTGTGNSLVLARGLAARLDGSVALRHMATLRATEPVTPPSTVVGLVYPVYVACAPRLVSRFVDRLDLPEDTYVFAVTNAASVAGAAIAQIEKQLARRDHSLAAGYILKMPGNYTPLYGADKETRQQRYFAQAQADLDRVAAAVNERRCGVGNRGLPPLTWLAGLGTWMLERVLKEAPRKFRATAACTGCGRCTRICPTDNIRLEQHRPVWGNACEQCMACLQWCPTEAIQCGRTEGRKRYHHPDVTAQELIDARQPPDEPALPATEPTSPQPQP